MSTDCQALLARRAGLLEGLTPEEEMVLLHDWRYWARPGQLAPPGSWLTWLPLAGRGWGKTRVGAEWAISRALEQPGSRGALVGATPDQVRDVMLEGESGILSISAPWFKPVHNPAKRLIMWPNGSTAKTYSAFNYEQLRGPQHHWAWCDELAKWRWPQEAWDQLQLGLRLPPHANCCVTTTPRPLEILKELIRSSDTVVTRGTTYENLVNLSGNFRKQVLERYEGTRLGRQELNAEMLEDLEGALWTHALLDVLRCSRPASHELQRVVVAVDPSGGDEDGNDEQGITAQGLRHDGVAVLLEDGTCKLSPAGWGAAAVRLAVKHEADCIVYEANFGGKMVEHVIQGAAEAEGVTIRTKEVHASRGKSQRAEPVAALYEQGKVKHAGTFGMLEDELCLFTPQGYAGGKSPNRADALVWGMTELLVGGQPAGYGDTKEVKGKWGRRR